MILCSGCFDGIHAGHVAYLTRAKQLWGGEVLAVAVAPDAYIRERKQREPYFSQTDRVRALQELRCVDLALAQKELSVAPLIELLLPTAFVKGDDFTGKGHEDVLETCQRLRIPIQLTPDTQRTHTREARG